MKKIVSVVLLLVSSLGVSFAQSADPVVMNLAGKDVTRSEFEYYYNKNRDAKEKSSEGTSVENYVDLFINYKLKVQAAVDAQLDTLSSFNKEFRTYRDMQLRPHLSDPEYVDSLSRVVYDNMKSQVGDSDMVLIAHIMMVLPQKAGNNVKESKKARIDSVYQALQGGADFTELAKKCSEDYTTSSKGGELPWFGPKQTLPEFEKVAYSLKPGEYSKPFLSTVGYHIILMKERKPLESYSEKKGEIVQLLEARGLKDMAAEHKITKMVEASHGTMSREDVIAGIQKTACESDPNLQYLIAEYHDGLLLYEASNRLIWEKAAKDEAGLEKYFKKNKAKYKWESPRFKGFLILSKSKAMMDDACKFLKKFKDETGVAAFNKSVPKDSVKNIRVKFGIFKDGEDANVDHLEFGKAAPKVNKFYPNVETVGKQLSKPASYKDVKAQVVSDYQDEKEKEWVEDLRKKYPVTINKEVLATVNKH